MPQFDTQFFSSLLFWEWVSFGILLLILYKYAFPWILENLDARERKIRETIEAAERQRAEAERRMAEYDARMRSAQKEAEEMIAQAKVRAQQMMEENERRMSAEAERSEEHTSELQSQSNLVCRLLLEKKKIQKQDDTL